LFTVLAERDDLRLRGLTLEIHMSNPLVPTAITFAAGVIFVGC
jgi:hypothetical protein